MEKLVGEYLRDLTSLTSTQIVDALRSQLILKDEGNHKLIGELLLDAGHITRDQLDEALQRQRLARNREIGPPGFNIRFGSAEPPQLSL